MNEPRQAQNPESPGQAPCPAIFLVGMDLHSEVNDAIDAYNIAAGYARRGTRECMWVPSPLFQDHRAVWHAYCNAVRDAARQRNRIWGQFNAHGIPSRGRAARRPSGNGWWSLGLPTTRPGS